MQTNTRLELQFSMFSLANMYKKFLFVAFIVCLVSLDGCSINQIRVINAYQGPKLPLSKLAILYTPQKLLKQNDKPVALLAGVNGKNYSGYIDGYPTISKVLPGKDTINVLCADGSFNQILILRTQLKPGHFYELSCDLAKATAKDRGTDDPSIRKLMLKAAKQ